MAEVSLTATVDSGGLMRAIPEIVAFGRRTMMEQCVTSAAFICRDAMELTTFVTVGRIDSDLAKEITVGTNKSGKPRQGNKMTVGQATILARMNPSSNFNEITGNRWAMRRPGFSSGVGRKRVSKYFRGLQSSDTREFWNFVDQTLERMKRARHSSTHFLKAGWKPAMKKLFEHPDFRGGKRKGADKGQLNLGNTLKNDMGFATVQYTSDQVQVMASNEVGESVGKSNSALALKHRQALIEHALPAAQAAVDWEEREIGGVVAERMEDGMERFNKMLA